MGVTLPPWKRIDLKGSMIGSGVVAGILTALLYFSAEIDAPIIWFLGGLIWIGIFIWDVAEAYYGRRKHGRFVHDRRLRWFYQNGFTIENRGYYWGLKGVHKGYFCRIFFNWETALYKRSHELTMMVYHTPCLNKKGEVDVPRLDKLNEKLKPGSFSTSTTRLKAETAYIIHHTPFMFATTNRRMRKRLEKAIAVCTQNVLEPISESNVEELIQEDAYLHGPDIEVFQENFAQRT